MSEAHWSDFLKPPYACEEAYNWAKLQPSYEEAWASCHRADWLLWLGGRLSTPGSPERKLVVLAACACARTALRHVKDGETRPLHCIEVTEAWARGEATLDAVRVARLGGRHAAAAAAADYAAAAAVAAADYAAAAATTAAATAGRYVERWREAKASALAEMAPLVRGIIPMPKRPS